MAHVSAPFQVRTCSIISLMTSQRHPALPSQLGMRVITDNTHPYLGCYNIFIGGDRTHYVERQIGEGRKETARIAFQILAR